MKFVLHSPSSVLNIDAPQSLEIKVELIKKNRLETNLKFTECSSCTRLPRDCAPQKTSQPPIEVEHLYKQTKKIVSGDLKSRRIRI